jgi:hypothetical protein
MTIPIRDLKILWSRAAGRCSLPDCRKKLVDSASESTTSKNILIGENCHIVAESDEGPRGKSQLSLDERNRYPNLILLCKNHHAEIDQDTEKWSIEKLHQIKAEHEIWVETSLTEVDDTPAKKLYSKLINCATESLSLDYWKWLTDNAINDHLPTEFVEEAREFSSVIFKTIWPNEIPELEINLKNVSNRVSQYIDYYLTFASLNQSEKFFTKNTPWRQDGLSHDERENLVKAFGKWQRNSFILLGNLVLSLNEFAECVRKFMNPEYFLYEGKFSILDSLGVTNEMKGCEYLPEQYQEIEP